MRSARAATWLLPLGVAALLACEGRQRSSSRGTAPHEEQRAGPAIAVLDLSDGVPEQPPTGWLGLSSRGASMDALVLEMEHLARDKDVRGVLVRLSGARIGLARAGEVGALLSSIGAKVPVWCHADDFANATLYLAAQGCRRVWVSPAASVDAIGLAAQTLYFHKLLADELGLEVDFLQVGKFKGAEEPFTREGPSPEARQSLEATLSDMRAAWLDGIRKGRPLASESAAEDGPYGAQAAKDRSLIDDVGYFDEARAALEASTGAVRSQVVLGPGAQSRGGDALTEVFRTIASDSLGTAPVALVRATGAISMDGSGPLGDAGGIVERRLSRTLTRLQLDDDVRAVVLRIDSPGGSALASDLLWHELMRLRAKKILVVSIGGMAASGGYYLASTGAVVFADETSIVGSIGVVGGKLAADRALEKIGVHGETFSAKVGDPHAATRAAYESLLAPWDDATRARVLETMTGIYDLFLQRVSEGRGVPRERIAASAEGRIFSGRHGMARGLVDEIGGLREAIARARAMAGLPADARVGVAGDGGGLLRALAEDDPESNARSRGLGAAIAHVAQENAPFIASLAPLALGDRSERALCAVPFALTIR